MNDKMSKYLFVDARDMTKTIYKSHSELIANDNVNIFEKDFIMCANEIFKQNNVPKEFRKIIIKTNFFMTPLFDKTDETAFEFISNKQIYLSINRKGSVRRFEGKNEHTVCLFDWYLSPQNNFIVYSNTHSYSEVISFIKQMKENGCLGNYLESLYNILGLTRSKYEYDHFMMDSKKFIMQLNK